MVNEYLVFEDLSKEEQYAVTQLKDRMIGSMNKDLYEDLCMFVRFVRARDLNIDAAENMLRKHLEWRRIHQVDSILTDYTPKEVCAKYLPFNALGLDKEGAPIIYFHLGNLDPRGLEKCIRKIDVMMCIVQKLEVQIQVLKEQSRKLGRHIDKWTMVFDFEGLTLSVATHKLTLEVLGNLIVMYEAQYPERLKIAFFINASIYFTMGFAVVKHFLSEKTYRKINIFGKDGWKEELLKVIDTNVLPAYMGGKRTDPDGNPLCETTIIRGGAVPASYFKYKFDNTLVGQPGVEKVTVDRMSKAHLTVAIDECGCHIEWEFETKCKDIGFALLFKKDCLESQAKDLIPKQRIDTSMFSETGMYQCEKPGIYIIEFDNTYSWIYQKEIFYRVKVVKDHLTD